MSSRTLLTCTTRRGLGTRPGGAKLEKAPGLSWFHDERHRCPLSRAASESSVTCRSGGLPARACHDSMARDMDVGSVSLASCHSTRDTAPKGPRHLSRRKASIFLVTCHFRVKCHVPLDPQHGRTSRRKSQWTPKSPRAGPQPRKPPSRRHGGLGLGAGILPVEVKGRRVPLTRGLKTIRGGAPARSSVTPHHMMRRYHVHDVRGGAPARSGTVFRVP
jgi:hypothetical protein